ncbi:MAG: hypothetical protein ACK5T1_00020 [Betaproteobacteria bacterium]
MIEPSKRTESGTTRPLRTPASYCAMLHLIGRGEDHPVVDPATVADLRAIRHLLDIPVMAPRVSRLRGLNAQWALFIEHLPRLAALLDSEGVDVAQQEMNRLLSLDVPRSPA